MRTSSAFPFVSGAILAVIFAIGAIAPAVRPARADVIELEGGGRVRGEILSETPKEVTIRTTTGVTQVFKREEIARIERERNPEQEYQERAKRLGEGSAPGWYDLGKFAEEKGLKERAADAWKRAIALDPEHAEARAALGHRKHRGRWYDEAGYKRAVEGLVEWNGQWVTPDDRDRYEQGFTKNEKGEWVRAEDLARQEMEKRAESLRPRKPAEPQPKPGEPRKPGPPATPEPEGPTTTPRGGEGQDGEKKAGEGSKPGAKPKAGKEIEPEDDSWYDDHEEVGSWDDALKEPYESKYYKIYSNIKPEYKKRYGLMMDVYNQMGFQKVFNAKERLKHGFPKGSITIYASQQDFMAQEGMGESVGGYYQPGQNRVVCFHGRFGMTGTTRTVLTHEGTHQFEDFVIPGKMWNAPVWIIEGFAVFFESAIYDAKQGKVAIGNIPRDRLMNLKQGISSGNYIKLDELIRTPQPAFTGFHYAHAWSLIYFIVYSGETKAERKRRQEIFSKLFYKAERERVTPEHVEELWGGAEKFKAWEEEWKKWIAELPYDWDPAEALKRAEAGKKPPGKDKKKDAPKPGPEGGETPKEPPPPATPEPPSEPEPPQPPDGGEDDEEEEE